MKCETITKEQQAKDKKIDQIAGAIRSEGGVAFSESYGIARMIVNGEIPGVVVEAEKKKPGSWWYQTIFREEAPK